MSKKNAQANTGIKIDTNVPPPPDGFRSERSKVIKEMNIGDSIFVTGGRQEVNSWRGSMHYHGFRPVSRQEGAGYRIWKMPRLVAE